MWAEQLARAASTLMEIVPETIVSSSASVTLAVKLKVGGATDPAIVPPIAPAGLRLKPVGRLPELTTQVKGPTPPASTSVDE